MGPRKRSIFTEPWPKSLNERVSLGIGTLEHERFRLFWDNLPIWPELRRLSQFLEGRGASLVTSLYTWAWAQLAVGEEDPIGDWVQQYLYKANFHLNKRIEDYVTMAEHYQLDGFLSASNRSCKFVSQDIPEVRRAVTDRTGIPGVILEADHNDPRLYSIRGLGKADRQLPRPSRGPAHHRSTLGDRSGSRYPGNENNRVAYTIG